MLFRLELENFYSIKDSQVIDLRVAENAPDVSQRFAPIHDGSRERAPKVIAIFGPNASGKSMALRGLSFLAWFVQHSFLQLPAASDTPPGLGFQPCERFYSHDTSEQLTRLCAHQTFTFTLTFKFSREVTRLQLSRRPARKCANMPAIVAHSARKLCRSFATLARVPQANVG